VFVKLAEAYNMWIRC